MALSDFLEAVQKRHAHMHVPVDMDNERALLECVKVGYI